MRDTEIFDGRLGWMAATVHLLMCGAILHDEETFQMPNDLNSANVPVLPAWRRIFAASIQPAKA